MAKGGHSRVFARIGLLGNPSDLYKGKVISVTIKNYYADVWIDNWDQGIVFEPNPELDLLKFQSFDTFVRQVQMFGYHAGGVALQKATAAEFFEYCHQHGTVVENRPFRLRYSSNIPRERGLSGSSAICCATLHCLINFFDVDIPLDERAEVVLAAEKRIGILGGLQDRAAQCFGGLLFMDFSDSMKPHYVRIPDVFHKFPGLFLIFHHDVKVETSGSVHAAVQRHWQGARDHLQNVMDEIAGLAKVGCCMLQSQEFDADEFGKLMSQNFRLRQSVFANKLNKLDCEVIRMVEEIGGYAKLCGSGGAVVCLCSKGPDQEALLFKRCSDMDMHCERVEMAVYK